MSLSAIEKSKKKKKESLTRALSNYDILITIAEFLEDKELFCFMIVQRNFLVLFH
jgi:hypothetical protein